MGASKHGRPRVAVAMRESHWWPDEVPSFGQFDPFKQGVVRGREADGTVSCPGGLRRWSYSAGPSEEIFGRAVRQFVNRDQVVIAMKVWAQVRPRRVPTRSVRPAVPTFPTGLTGSPRSVH